METFKTKPSSRKIILKTASGGEVGHYGERDIIFKNGDDLVGLKFQVTDVRKLLFAVRRLVEEGNMVQFGSKPDQNFITNVQTGKRIATEWRGGQLRPEA